MIGKAVGHERIGPNVSGATFRNTDSLLPDWPGIGHLENFRLRIKEFVEIGKINMGPNPIGPEIVNAEKWGQINFSRDSLAGGDTEWFARGIGDRRDLTAFISGNLKAEPGLAVAVMKIDIASGQIRNYEISGDWLVSDVLKARKFQFHLELGVRAARGGQAKQQHRPARSHENVNYRKGARLHRKR